MKRLTTEEIAKIKEIDGTLKNDRKYFEKIAEILSASNTHAKWTKADKFFSVVEEVQLDKSTFLSITFTKANGRVMVKNMGIVDNERTDKYPYGQTEVYFRKNGELVKCLRH